MKQALLRGKYVVTDPAKIDSSGFLTDGAILVEDGKVADVGPYLPLKTHYAGAEEIGSERHVVLPGLVNAHHHGRGFMGIQLGILDGPLEVWLLDYWRQRPLDVFLDTLYANIRMLRAGVTTVVHSGYSRDWSQTEAEAKASLRAYDESGIRVAFAVGVEDQNTFVYQDNETFISSLPEPLRQRIREALHHLGPSQGYDYFKLVGELLRQYAGHARIKVLYGPTGPEWCSPGLLRKIADRARTDDTGIHLHCLESPIQRDFSHQTYGKSSVAFLHEVGILGPKSSLAHGTWLSDDDIKVCADTGCSICHNASSNLRLHNGVAPVARMLELGANVGIGMDGWSLNSDDDMLQEMRLVSYLHRLPREMRPAPSPSASDIIRMATLGGAKPSCFETQLGSLVVGASADAVLIDYEALARPYLDKRTPFWEAIVGLGRGSHVDAVMVGGEVLVNGGRYLKRNEQALLDELSVIADEKLPENLSEFYDALDDLKPYVKKFYEGWRAVTKIEPVYTVNSRT